MPDYTAHGHRQLLLYRIKQYWPSFNLSFLWLSYCTGWKHWSSNKIPSKSAGSTALRYSDRWGPLLQRLRLIWPTTPGTGERWPLPRLVYLCLGSVWVWSANGEKFDPLLWKHVRTWVYFIYLDCCFRLLFIVYCNYYLQPFRPSGLKAIFSGPCVAVVVVDLAAKSLFEAIYAFSST